MVRFYLVLFSILLFGLKAVCQDELLSGLYFSSHEVVQDKRTSLNLTPDDPFHFPDGFSLEMETRFRKGDGYYGYIFRLIGNGHTNIDLVSNLASTKPNFWLVVKDKVLFAYQWSDIPNGGLDRWIKIRLEVDVKHSKLCVSFNGKKMEAQTPELNRLKNFELIFGACRKASFLNTDVSPMSLKDIRVLDPKNRLVYNWKLNKHSQRVVYDEKNNTEAQVENPIWNIDKHVNWRKQTNFDLENIVGVARDEWTGRIFFVGKNAVYVLTTQTMSIDTLQYSAGTLSPSKGTQIIYNQFTNELWSYNISKNLQGEINKFNFATLTWSYDRAVAMETDYWHHNKFISPIDSSLVALFGYGHYTYKSVVNKYSHPTQTWIQSDCSNQIQPRYLSAFGFLNQKEALVFGGYGSKTGRQELSPEFYYDLYKLNLNDYSFTKLWTLNMPSTPFVPCESLIADEQNGLFYTLLYNRGNYSTYMHLARFKTENPEYQLYNDSISYNFLDTESWSTLLLDQKTSQLFAVTSHNSEVSLYSIAYPPLLPEDVYQHVPVKGKWYLWMVVILVGILGLISVLIIRKKRAGYKNEGLYTQIDHPNILPIEPIERKTISSVYFMGGFQVYNINGRNITSTFSPTLKQLFLFIFLHTCKNGKGVSSAKLDEVLWYDKSGESARNNRNVNISKLRSILDEIEGIEVVTENSFWKIKMDEPVYCDYTEILLLLGKSKSVALTITEINKLIALLSFGEILPAVQNEWMDEFKAWFANEIIDGLSSLFNGYEVKSDFSLRYHLAECILVYDPLNDEAFSMKCAVLYHLGKKGMAKNLYDSFCREYKQVLGVDYSVSFSDTIK